MSFAEKRQRCQSQLQSGCPLSTDMLIHLCGLSKQRMRGNAPFFVLVARTQECSGPPLLSHNCHICHTATRCGCVAPQKVLLLESSSKGPLLLSS